MLTYDFRDRNNETLYEYLYRKIRADILTGQLAEGQRMPSKRAFAENLGVSVITVETAYAQLAAEGYLTPKPRSGYYVERIGQSVLLPEPSGGVQGGAYAEEVRDTDTPDEIDLTQSGISSSMFPFQVWSRLMREVFRDRREELLVRAPGNGIVELRTAISGFLRQYRGLSVSPDQIVIGAGAEYLYSLLIRLLGYDKIYAVETPGYRKTEMIYASSSVCVKGIPMDRSGVDVELLRSSGADVIHISPSHQFPTGITMPVSRRSELLAWSAEAPSGRRRYIIEDDYDSEFRLAGRPIPSLMSIDGSGSVIYLNTFAKSVSPAIRISYMVLPEGLLREYMERLGFYSCTVANFEQYVLAEFIRRGHFEKHINRMRSYYRQKRDRLVGVLKQSRLGDIAQVRGADAGLHFLLTVHTDSTENELTESAQSQGVRIYGLRQYAFPGQEGSGSPGEGKDPCMVVNYAGLSDEQIDMLPGRLMKVWIP